MSLRTTIVGCGAVAQRLYRKPLQMLEKRGILQVAALVDPQEQHAAALSRYFRSARTHRSLDEALASGSDLTLILTPAHLHCEQTVQALQHGSHVLCEKPMANSATDCARMNAAASECSRVLAIGMVRRFFPAFAQFRDIIQSGQLGALRCFEYHEGHRFDWDVTTPAAFRPRSSGGTGVLFDIGPHVVDHLQWTFGELEVSSYRDDALAGIESDAALQLRSPLGPGSMHISWDCPHANELRVFGSGGEAVLRVDRFDQLALRREAGRFEPQPLSVSFRADASRSTGKRLSPKSYPEAVYVQLIQVVRAIELGESPACDGRAGERCVRLLEAALARAEALPVPWLAPDDQAAFRRLHWRSVA